MKVIGLVGGIGAGKSTVISLMNEMKPMNVISADLIGHDILLKGHVGFEPVIDTFGKDIVDESGEIDRKRLGEKVFADPIKLQTLNQITHPLIKQCIKEKIAYYNLVAPDKPIILEAALLIESGLIELTDLVIAVYADAEKRLLRVVNRDQLPKEQIWARMQAQKSWEELNEIADYVIDNSVSLENTKKEIKVILENL